MKPLFVALMLSSSTVFAADFKAAYVDLRRAVAEVEDGKAARARLQAFVEGKQKTIEDERLVLLKEQDAMEKQTTPMSEDARKKKEEELQNKVMALARKAESTRAEINEQERRELSVIAQRMEPLLGTIADKDGFTMVFDKGGSGLAWAPASLDVTNELIRTYNDTFKGKPAKAAAPAGKAGDAPKAPAPAKK